MKTNRKLYSASDLCFVLKLWGKNQNLPYCIRRITDDVLDDGCLKPELMGKGRGQKWIIRADNVETYIKKHDVVLGRTNK